MVDALLLNTYINDRQPHIIHLKTTAKVRTFLQIKINICSKERLGQISDADIQTHKVIFYHIQMLMEDRFALFPYPYQT